MKPIKRMVMGYPATLEALCLMIKEGQTHTTAFMRCLEHNGLTESEAWDVYEAWHEKRVHTLAVRANQRLYGNGE